MLDRHASLVLTKLLHTLVWAFFASCILAIPLAAARGDYDVAAMLAAVVLVEVAVLACNHMRCPLTSVAARYTTDRRDNFDIYLPEWLAKTNKWLFGTLYVLGMLFAIAHWWLRRGA